jgi:two-component system phosphate regulon sensor histidine kinase PhoR
VPSLWLWSLAVAAAALPTLGALAGWAAAGAAGAVFGGGVRGAAVVWVLVQRLSAGERSARERASSDEQLGARLAQLEGENERHRSVFAAMAEGVLVLEAERRVVAANEALSRLLDLKEAPEGRTLLEVVRSGRLADAVEAVLQGRGPQEEELELRRPDGAARVLRLRAVPFRPGPDPQGAVAVLHDETSMRHLERMRRDFVASISHEFRTPLTAIRGFAETLATQEVPAEKRIEFSRIIHRHSERLGQLLDDLLTLARIEARRQPIELEPVEVGALVREILGELRPRLEAEGLAIEADEARVGARADRRALRHVLSNLLDNAIKYSPEGGRIHVRFTEGNGAATIEVGDTGLGIPSRDLPRVFERFYRVDPARAAEVPGSGLGLAIVKHLVEAMGGEVSVESELGRGSTFRVTLPSR